MSGKKENVQSSGITRRDFVKGLAIGAAGLGIATILPGGIITAASAADTTTTRRLGSDRTMSRTFSNCWAPATEEPPNFTVFNMIYASSIPAKKSSASA